MAICSFSILSNRYELAVNVPELFENGLRKTIVNFVLLIALLAILAACSTSTLSIQEELEGMGFVFDDEHGPNFGRVPAGDDWDTLALRSDSGVSLWLRLKPEEEKNALRDKVKRWNDYTYLLAKRFVPGYEQAAYDWLWETWFDMNEQDQDKISFANLINLRSDSRYFDGELVEAWSYFGDLFNVDGGLAMLEALTDPSASTSTSSPSDGFWVVAYGESLSQQLRALSPSSELAHPATRLGQWRDAMLHKVVWVDNEISEGVDNLPTALSYGTVIETVGPANAILGCRIIFIVGEPPFGDFHGINEEIWSKTVIRVPERLAGEHFWKFRTIGCQEWKIVESP